MAIFGVQAILGSVAFDFLAFLGLLTVSVGLVVAVALYLAFVTPTGRRSLARLLGGKDDAIPDDLRGRDGR